ncbi:MAG: hypothetical protein ACYDH4_09190 [Candidatus Cryosericum sp.]
MRRLRYSGWKQREGIALLLVMFIAFASLILLTTLFSSLAPRSLSVRGQAQSDRALALADGTVDRLLDQINNTGLSYSVVTPESADALGEDLVKQLLVGINGGIVTDSYATVSANVRRYFYDIQTDTYYVLKSGTAATGTLTNLSTGSDVSGGLQGIDAGYATDNRWFELDANAKYWINPGTPDTWEIGATAFNLSTPDVKRTIRAEAQRGDITMTPVDVANGNWYIEATKNDSFFSDYSGLYHSKVYFGRFEVTSGYVRSDSDLWMGGWAKDKVSAHGTVNDMAIDDSNRHDGRFGIDAVGIGSAGLLVTNNVPAANWPNGNAALTTLFNNAKLSPYYVNSNATIVFSVVGGVGKVTINDALLDLPANGAIYVNGDATVSGTLNGQVTVGASDDVFIGGSITYNDPPRTNKNTTPIDATLQDKLGLIARNDIIIPVSTYNANKTLRIDAAMLAVQGYFGLDANASYAWHDINSSPHWVGIWNGSQSVYGSGSAPAISSGSSVKGYEEQHTNYDYNLGNGARPPFFPAADDTVASYLVYDVYSTPGSVLDELQSRTRSQLTAVTAGSDPSAYAEGMRYKYRIGTTWYYFYGTDFNDHGDTVFTGGYLATKNSLYRVSWKEEIAQPVGTP